MNPRAFAHQTYGTLLDALPWQATDVDACAELVEELFGPLDRIDHLILVERLDTHRREQLVCLDFITKVLHPLESTPS